MIPLNWNTNLKTSLSIFQDKVLPLFEDYRIRLAAAAVFAVLGAALAIRIYTCIRGKIASKKRDEVFSSTVPTYTNTNLHTPKQITAGSDPKDTKLQNLEEENQRLKRELEAAKQVHSATQPSDKKSAIESEMQLKVQELEDELLSTKSQLQESERKLTETKNELETSKAKWQEDTKQYFTTQRKKLVLAHQKEIESLKAQIAAGQKPEDVKLLEQLRKLLNLDPAVNLDRKLKKEIFGSRSNIPAECQNLFDLLRRSKELNRLANTPLDDFSPLQKVEPKTGIQKSHKPVDPKAGIPESDQLIKNIKSLLIEIKSLKDEKGRLVESNEILSGQIAKLSQKAEQKSMNVSQIK